MYFNQRNTIIIFTIIIFAVYLVLPAPIILIKKKNNLPTCCNSCVNESQ